MIKTVVNFLLLGYVLVFTYANDAYANHGVIADHYAFGDVDTLGEGLGRLITPAFSIATVAVIFYLIIGGFKYLTSQGDQEAISSAQQMITHAIIGFVLLIFLFLVLQFIPQFFGFRLGILI